MTLFVLVTALFLVIDSGKAIASTQGGTAGRPSWAISTKAKYGHIFRADLKDGDGSFSLHEAGVELSFAKMLPDLNGILNFSLECGVLDFDLDANGNDLFDEAGLFDKVIETSAGINLILNRGEWSYMTTLSVGTACEDHSSVEDSVLFNGGLGAIYQMSEHLKLGFGLFVGTQLEDDTMVIPFVSVEYRPADRLTLAVRDGLSVEYELDKGRTSLTFEGKYKSHRFRLDKTAPLANGVADYQLVPITLGLR
ncbi:MAG: hypothetical protein JW941_08210, partial [Candidatus Coatesbacteria bacterium]|nr:hypothetical protein [Candidatus Coatesbacteria bacterium]